MKLLFSALKKRFAKNIEIANLSTNFIMINLEKKESVSKLYRPDGDYVPRIFFLGNWLIKWYFDYIYSYSYTINIILPNRF